MKVRCSCHAMLPPPQEARLTIPCLLRLTIEYEAIRIAALCKLLGTECLMVSPSARLHWRERGKRWNRMENLMGMLHLSLQEQSSQSGLVQPPFFPYHLMLCPRVPQQALLSSRCRACRSPYHPIQYGIRPLTSPSRHM